MHHLPQQIPGVARQAMTALAPAFERSHVLESGEWVARCAADMAQLWQHGDLWAITEVQSTKDGRALHVVACAGQWDAGELLAEIEAWGRRVGCNEVFLTGRRGWARKLPDYRIETITMRKGL